MKNFVRCVIFIIAVAMVLNTVVIGTMAFNKPEIEEPNPVDIYFSNLSMERAAAKANSSLQINRAAEEIVEAAEETEQITADEDNDDIVFIESDFGAAYEEESTPAEDIEDEETAEETAEAVEEDINTEEVKEAEAETYTEKISIEDEIASRGNYGRLYISSVGVDVAVFYTTDFSVLQKVVDAEDSACMFDWHDGNKLIADHNYQGFESIKSCTVGTYAEIVTSGETKGYTCLDIIYNGWNHGDCLTYNDYTPIAENYCGYLVMYTCNTNGTVTITIWG